MTELLPEVQAGNIVFFREIRYTVENRMTRKSERSMIWQKR